MAQQQPAEMSSRPDSQPVVAAISFDGVRAPALQSAASLDSVEEDVAEKPEGGYDGGMAHDSSWASPDLSRHQAPVLDYDDSRSSVNNSTDSFHSYHQTRKRFKAPFRPQVYDREAGNPKPWMKGRTRITRDKKSYFTTLFGISVGFGLGVLVIVRALLAREGGDTWCPVLEDEFDGDSLNTSAWRVEQRVGGGESNDFTWFTGHNSYVADGNLFIVPTLTRDTLLETDYATMNSTYLQLGAVCDSIHQTDCFIQADTETNETLVIPPVQSAMISTRDKVTIRRGRVVVKAKMPTGDWLWPQISLVSQNEEYGAYPASGLITVFETRGNKAELRSDQLNNEAVTGLHFGPIGMPNLTQGLYKVYRNFFDTRYYEFGLDWTEQSITMWINTRVRIMFRYGFGKKNFFDLGNFGYAFANHTIITNPWAGSENPHQAPFDKDMYLRLAVLAGGLDGYWDDSLRGKPWRNSDSRSQGMTRLMEYANDWLPSWPSGDKIRERGLAIDSIKMYQKCK
ncbi:hypothetical protein JCM10213_007062 [Rhodosporidiobolus nylandii]